MTDLERQLTAALERLSAQYETEQRRHSEQVEALQRQVERLSGRVTDLTGYSGTFGAGPSGGWWKGRGRAGRSAIPGRVAEGLWWQSVLLLRVRTLDASLETTELGIHIWGVPREVYWTCPGGGGTMGDHLLPS